MRFVLVSQLPALMELSLAALIALLAAVFSSADKVVEYAPVAFIIKHTGFTFLHDQRYLAFALLIALWLAVLLKNVTNMLQAYMSSIFAENVSRKFTLRIMQFFLRAPWQWHLNKGVVDLNHSFGCAQHMGGVLNTFSQLIANISVVIFLFVGLLVVAPVLSLALFAVAGGAALLIVYGVRRYFDTINQAIYTKQLELARASYFALHGMKEARLHGREQAIYNDYSVRSQLLMRFMALRITVARLPVALIETIAFLFLPLIMYFLLAVQGASMTKVVAVMGFLAGAAWRVLPAINRLVDNVMAMRAVTPNVRNVLERFAEQKSLETHSIPPDANASLPFTTQLHMQNLAYTYPKSSEPALDDVSLRIPKGRMVGIVGLSGAGKSTLVAVLTGLLAPSSGKILVDDIPLSPALFGVWRKKLGYVPQSPFIFNDTIAANIALSDWGQHIRRDRVRECCQMAALDFVDTLDDGIDTLVGDRGMRLSGGQTQRLAIARALYDAPEILIFDEATSSLDMQNERAIHDTLLALRNNITMIIIAHRLSTVEDCDHIIWLDKGRVKKQGKAADVLEEYTESMRENTTETP